MSRFLNALKRVEAQEASSARIERAGETEPSDPVSEIVVQATSDEPDATSATIPPHAPADHSQNAAVAPLTDRGIFVSADENRIDDGSNVDGDGSGCEAAYEADIESVIDENSGPDLIDDLNTTIQRELAREADGENQESHPLPNENPAPPPQASHEATEAAPRRSTPAPPDDVVKEPQLAAAIEPQTTVPAEPNSVDPAERITSGRSTDEFRQLAKNINAQWSEDDAASLLIASTEPSGEVTSVVAQLAIALAEEQKGSILVVGIGQKAEAAQCLEADPQPPWADVLAGRRDWRDQIRPSATRGLDVLAAPIAAALAVERGPARIEAVLSELCCHYRLVLVDGSGVDADHLGTLAEGCAGVYLVVGLQQTMQRAAKLTLKHLKTVNTRLMGCIATGARR